MSKGPELTAAKHALPCARFYDLPITPIPEEKLAVLTVGPIDPNLALKVEDRNDLFKPGRLPCEIGYCVMPDGTGFLANRTEMPGVTSEVFEWWFAWHSLEDLRYRIWDPEDHYYTRQQMRGKTLGRNLLMRERTWNTVHHVSEDVGPSPDGLVLEFRYPHELGYEEEKVGTDACAALTCANDRGPIPGQGVAAIMTHSVREIPGGIELRSRFWISYDLVDGRLVKLVPDGVSVPEKIPMDLLAHNLRRSSHLAAILPQVYTENEDS